MKNQSKAKRKKKQTKKPKPTQTQTENPKKSHTLFPLCTNKSNLFDGRVNVDNVVAVILPRAPLVLQETLKADVHWLNGENSTYFVYFMACFYKNRRASVYTRVP